MNVEDLSKAQLILLTLLVSFVTSIATGVVTVSLMDRAPAGVTQTVHKVVERTVERVVPKDASDQSASAGETVREVTKVVKEDDAINQTIATNSKHLVRLYAGTGSTGMAGTSTAAQGQFLGLGLLVADGRYIATSDHLIGRDAEVTGQFASGTSTQLRPLAQASTSPVRLLQPISTSTPERAATLAAAETLKLGQTVISLSGKQRNRVATGIIAELIEDVGPQADVRAIHTNIDRANLYTGSPLVSLFQEVVGIAGPPHDESGSRYIPASAIAAAIERHAQATSSAMGTSTAQ